MIQYNNYKDIKEYFKEFYWINLKGCPVHVETLTVIKSKEKNYGIVRVDDTLSVFEVDNTVEFDELNQSIQDSLTYWHKRDLRELKDNYVYPFILVEKTKDEVLKLYNRLLSTILKRG